MIVTMAIVLGVVCAIAAGLFVYEYFAGENPLLDTFYDVWLRRQQLDTLERRFVENPKRTNAIVTLTTLPSRIDRIGLTIKSLLNQTVQGGRDAKLAHPAIRFRNLDTSDRQRPIRPSQQLVPMLWPVRPQVIRDVGSGNSGALIPEILAG